MLWEKCKKYFESCSNVSPPIFLVLPPRFAPKTGFSENCRLHLFWSCFIIGFWFHGLIHIFKIPLQTLVLSFGNCMSCKSWFLVLLCITAAETFVLLCIAAAGTFVLLCFAAAGALVLLCIAVAVASFTMPCSSWCLVLLCIVAAGALVSVVGNRVEFQPKHQPAMGWVVTRFWLKFINFGWKPTSLWLSIFSWTATSFVQDQPGIDRDCQVDFHCIAGRYINLSLADSQPVSGWNNVTSIFWIIIFKMCWNKLTMESNDRNVVMGKSEQNQ